MQQCPRQQESEQPPSEPVSSSFPEEEDEESSEADESEESDSAGGQGMPPLTILSPGRHETRLDNHKQKFVDPSIDSTKCSREAAEKQYKRLMNTT